MTKCVLIVQLEIPQIHHNLFGPSAQIWDIFEKSSHHMFIVHGGYYCLLIGAAFYTIERRLA